MPREWSAVATLVALALLLATGPAALAGETDEIALRAVVFSLDQAIARGDERRAEVQFTPRLWSRGGEPGRGLFLRLARQRRRLRLASVDAVDRRAVLSVDVLDGAAVAERIQLYAVTVGRRVLIDGVDGERGDPIFFLQCRAPGISHTPAVQPGGQRLAELAAALLAAATDPPHADAGWLALALELPGVDGGGLQRLRSELARVGVRRAVSTTELGGELGCLQGAIVFEGGPVDAGGADRVTAYVSLGSSRCQGVTDLRPGDVSPDRLVAEASRLCGTRRAAYRNHCGPCFSASVGEAVWFDDNSARIPARASVLLEQVAAYVVGNQRRATAAGPEPAPALELGGYRDRAEENPRLGLARAKATRARLIALGVRAEGLRVVDYGDLRPLCVEPGRGCSGWNGRVDFHPGACADEISH